MGHRRLVIMYLVRSGEGSVIDRLRGDDAARATRRVEKQEVGQDKNRRRGGRQGLYKRAGLLPPSSSFLLLST